MSLTQARLKEILTYYPDDGYFIRNHTKHAVKPGQKVGSTDPRGYVKISVDGKTYKAHRLAWLYMTGRWPADQIDHIDQNKSNNRFSNLREATRSQNRNNTPVRPDSRTGIKGVRRMWPYERWIAVIMKDGVRRHIGCYATPELAQQAYAEAAQEAFGEFSYTGYHAQGEK